MLFTPHFEKQRHVQALWSCWKTEREWKPEDWFDFLTFCRQTAV